MGVSQMNEASRAPVQMTCLSEIALDMSVEFDKLPKPKLSTAANSPEHLSRRFVSYIPRPVWSVGVQKQPSTEKAGFERLSSRITQFFGLFRSEERRVGKECRSRW